MVRMLDDDEADTHEVRIRSENGVTQSRSLTIISESGLYNCILRSQRPEAKRFRKWVTSEVLPTLRRTGTYTLDVAQVSPPPIPMEISERGATLIAANRTFREFYRTGLTLRLSRARAAEKANAVAFIHTGINVLEELNVKPLEIEVSELTHRYTPTDGMPDALREWVAAQTSPFTLADTAQCLGIDPEKLSETRGLQTRIGDALRLLGCAKFRSATGGRGYYYRRTTPVGNN
jgi:prophage antirepressor-like protein